MIGHRLEVADVFRQHEQEFFRQWGHMLNAQQRRAFRDICACRTAALGAHVVQCDQCAHQAIAYNSCRNRSCPKCQSTARDKWLTARTAELLPVPYCHVVFTLPQEISTLALQNQRLIHGILFRAVSETLLVIAADPRRLGAHVGFLAVLHTWNQQMLYHPHLHCVVPSGGLSPDRSRWIPSRARFFLPVKVLGKLFRGKFLAFLASAFRKKKLRLAGTLAHLATPSAFDRFLRQLRSKNWVVYAKRPFGGPQYVIRYLARYTHRVAISNGRLIAMQDGQVTFRWRDSAHGNEQKLMTLDAVEFIRRYLLHILPSGFVKIRHFGFLANRNRRQDLALCRALLPTQADQPPDSLTEKQRNAVQRRCPVCQTGTLRIVDWISAAALTVCSASACVGLDTS
ncbi:MAG: IS91 family transposase [Bryobacteraceae bacterium]